MTNKKVFILDTSVLLYDKNSIHSFPDSEVIIPLIVLDEVDRFKEKIGVVGEAARYVNRYLDEIRKNGNIHEGIEIETGQIIKVEIKNNASVPEGLDPKSADNRIIGLAVKIKQERDSEVTVITKDINFRVKCEDYNKDKIVLSQSQIYTGQRTEIVEKEIVDKFFSDKGLSLEDFSEDSNFGVNEFIIGKSEEGGSFMGRFNGSKIVPVNFELNNLITVNPKNKEQKFALDLLTDDSIPMVTLTGIAGSGKTYLTLMAAISSLKSGNHERIIITRSICCSQKDMIRKRLYTRSFHYQYKKETSDPDNWYLWTSRKSTIDPSHQMKFSWN